MTTSIQKRVKNQHQKPSIYNVKTFYLHYAATMQIGGFYLEIKVHIFSLLNIFMLLSYAHFDLTIDYYKLKDIYTV